ncbi:ABC transporter substrate-binding protein [Hoeflea sp. WL0058]|uniref:ABC transporter substrate-binding protein n=1 Tax=Flavimaribacter sediminis TaxID=2865987 RepID=A0AAE2ZFY8_9HYPH|nr:ABC transporter substrate-binding protein [Flavimaribacter sediminis]MBW8635853.1 ABC transporter substrate-binding protein [Flavimaribacter sediminis]
MRSGFIRIVMAVTALFLGVSAAISQELTVATPNDPSIDPHFLYVSTNAAYGRHLFGKLLDRDGEARTVPDLAVEWENVDPLTWRFKLREGVKFHDGSDFTAEDVIFSFDRVPNVPNNPASYASNSDMIESITADGPYEITIKTKTPYPLLLRRISGVSIVSKDAVEGKTTADFTSGEIAIGTGPYKFSEYIPGERYVMARNEDYWGEKPAYEKVTFLIMPNAASRVAALLGGDVDIVEGFSPSSVPTLEEKDGFYVAKRASSRTMWLYVDTENDVSPFVTDNDGNAMESNPLKDLKVREAISLSINREAIVERVMDGLAEVANQLVPNGWYSFDADIPEAKYNPEEAKKLLADAGYPDGFGLTIHAPNDRYVNDAKVAQAIAQMLASIGITTKVETMPKSVYFGRLNNQEFSLSLIGWDNSLTGSSMMGLMAAFHTRDKDKGYGSWNAGGYSNAEFDKAMESAEAEFDNDKREAYLKEAMDILIAEDQGAIPLYSQFTILGAVDGVKYTPRVDEHFSAMQAEPAS